MALSGVFCCVSCCSPLDPHPEEARRGVSKGGGRGVGCERRGHCVSGAHWTSSFEAALRAALQDEV